jgi:hypothetical protein
MMLTIVESCAFKKRALLTRLNFRDVDARYDTNYQ